MFLSVLRFHLHLSEMASKGEGEYKAGSHCQFCKVKATCRKRAEYNLELARYDFEMPESLEDDEIEVILAKADELVSWVGDIKEYALGQAVSGKEWNKDNFVTSNAIVMDVDNDHTDEPSEFITEAMSSVVVVGRRHNLTSHLQKKMQSNS